MRLDAVRRVVEPVIEAQGLEVDRLSVQRAGSREVLTITVDGDGPDGTGPSLDDIATCSQAISRALDDSGAAGEKPYVLQVSSPGVDRPLITPAQWRRNRDRLVEVRCHDGRRVTGRIVAVGAAGVDLLTDDSLTQFGYDDIASAIVQVELNRPAAPGDVDQAPERLTKELTDGQ